MTTELPVESSSKKTWQHKIKMSPSLKKVATFLLLVALTSSQQVEASGVFELEFIGLQELDSPSNSKTIATTDLINNNEKSKLVEQGTREPAQQAQQELIEDPENFVRVLVCLKEAFTSQLDGPCTFGNASITLRRDSIIQQSNNSKQGNNLVTNASQEQHAKSAQQGSQLTNIVRILFTFRWTKSFTIILTAEQLQVDVADNHQQRQLQPVITPRNLNNNHRPLHLVTIRHGTITINSSNLVDLSSTNRSLLKEPSLSGRSTDNQAASHIGPSFVVNKQQFIDRHVLTENEVLPNLEQNPNKPWSSRFSRSLKSSLAYRFRVYCSLNYYGDGCTTFCRPRDDQFGHYNCSSTGQKVCLEGWHGPDCDKAKCRPGCNQKHGYCDRPDTCQCRPGWTGPRCDECIPYPGCQNGYCLSPWQCICQRNWGGVLCDQDLNYCGTHEPCRNNGTCQNIAPGRYKCNCPDGFTGVDCSINMSSLPSASSLKQLGAGCAVNPCLNGGTCYGFNGVILGYGLPALLDTTTTANLTESQADGGDGNEFGSDQYYRCQCAPGWTGDYCQWSDSTALSVTNLLLNITTTTATTAFEKTFATTNSTDAGTLFSAGIDNSESIDKIAPTVMTFIESQQTALPHLNMRHLISGVVIASAVGVFVTALLLAWCCLIAIGRNKFSFIQMNIIRSGNSSGGGNPGEPNVSSTLRRMHEKIRDSFRRSSRNRIKPETKLSIENVLKPPRPPPTYEESRNNYNVTSHQGHFQSIYPLPHRIALDTILAQELSATPCLLLI